MPFNFFKGFQKRNMYLPSEVPYIPDGNNIIPNELISADIALQNSDVYAVVNRISSDIAACDIDCQDPQHGVIEKPNPVQTKFSFFQTVLASMLLNGNAYCTIHRNGSRVADELELVPSESVQLTLITDEKSVVDIEYTFNYSDGRPPKTLPSNEVLHFKLLSAGYEGNLYTGRSPLESLATELELQNQSHQLALNTIANGIYPQNILKIPEGKISPQTKDKIRRDFMKQNGGKNTGAPIVLDQSLDYQQVSINGDVAKFLNNYNFSQEQIAKAFGIPDSYLNGQGDQQSSADMLQNLYINSLSPYISPIEQELSKKLGVDVKVNVLSIFDRTHEKAINDVNTLLTSGAITPDQAQQILSSEHVYGLTPVKMPTPTVNPPANS